LKLPESVKQDVLAYRGQVEKFLSGETSPIAFRAYRVPMGIYEQRTAGEYMVRIRIGAGLVRSYQLERIAYLSKNYGNGIIHVTTRQDIQIHKVDIERTPDILEGLLEVGLSARGGGGNTVRNVTACPRAGVCPNERFNVAPYAVATAEYLLQDKSSFNLPRKYKIVFSGCSEDCAFASVADLGFFAYLKDGVKGFSVYAGGGLGSSPAVAIKIEDFVKDTEAFKVAEAIKRLFDKQGDRSNKHKARLRYVVSRAGPEEFIKLYRQERKKIEKQSIQGKIPPITEVGPVTTSSGSLPIEYETINSKRNVVAEKIEGMFTVKINLSLGDIPAEDLVEVARLADRFGQGLVRTTQLQNLLITGVPWKNIDKIESALAKLSIDVTANDQPEIVVCAGASTCKLGLCLSRGLADAISRRLNQLSIPDKYIGKVIRISGCPNSCGHHYIADIGLQGRAKRVGERLMPFYDVLADAKIVEGDSRLAERVGTISAKLIPDLLAEAFSNGTIDKKRLRRLVTKYSEVSEESLPDDYYYDYDSNEPFSLAGRGPGECGAGVMDVIKVDIDEGHAAIKSAEKTLEPCERSEKLYKAILASARALLVIFGLEPKKDREIFQAFNENLVEQGWVDPRIKQLLDDAIDWKMGDKTSLETSMEQVKDLTKRINELFVSLDANLKFKAKPFGKKQGSNQQQEGIARIDLRGVECPLNFVKAKLELEKIDIGDVLEILLDEGEPVRNVPDSFTEQGQEVLAVKKADGHYIVRIYRKK
jgi:sulfite reductase (ferredoxin)